VTSLNDKISKQSKVSIIISYQGNMTPFESQNKVLLTKHKETESHELHNNKFKIFILKKLSELQINKRVNQSEERINELKDRSFEITCRGKK
jgi:hypothetical protein